MSFPKESHLIFSPVRSMLIHWGTVYSWILLLALKSFWCCSSLQEPLNIPCTREKSELLKTKISFPKGTWFYFLLLSVACNSQVIHLQQCVLRLFCTGLRAPWASWSWGTGHILNVSVPCRQWASKHTANEREREFLSHCLQSAHTWAAPFFKSWVFLLVFLFYFILPLAAPCLNTNHTCVFSQ